MDKNKTIINQKKENKKISPKTISLNNSPKYFHKIKLNVLKSIKIKNKKEINIEKNIEKNINIIKKIKLLEEKCDNDNTKNSLIKIKNNNKKNQLIKRDISYSTNNFNREKVKFNGFKIFPKKQQKDFSCVTSNINLLLEKNQTLLMKEDKIFLNKPPIINIYKHSNKKFNKKNFKKINNFSSRNGMFGKKEKIPIFYDSSFTHKNDYLSKSDKNRHEILLNEINKLKFYLEQNPNDKLLIIKDFLQKFHIKNKPKYSDEKLLKLCKLLLKIKQNQLLNLIKPDSNLKKMVYNLLNISFEKDNNENNNYNTVNSYNNTFRKFKLNKYKTFYNFRTKRKKSFFDIYETNSKLKYLENQKDLDKPNKDYSENLDLFIYELSKEIKEIEKNIKNNRDIENNKTKDELLFITQKKNNSFSRNRINKKIILTPINRHKHRNNKKSLFLIYNKNFANINNSKTNYNFQNRTLNICLRKKNNNFYINNNRGYGNINNIQNFHEKNRIGLQEIIKRLYYIPTQKKFGLNDIKKNLKLTEYIALNFAKQKQSMNKIEYILNSHKEKN